MWDKERANALWNQGASYTYIGAELGVTRNKVAGHISRQGLRRGAAPRSPRMNAPRVRKVPTLGLLFKPAPVIEPIPEAEPIGITFIELTDHNCHYPLGADDEPATVFCGAWAVEGKPYCQAHMGLCYVPPAPSTKRAWRHR